MPDQSTREEAQTARRYFGSFADDYQRAFQGSGRRLLQGTINRCFRRKTFQRRTQIVRQLLDRHGVAGKQVLDLGCGSGEVSLVAARLGARVTGLDIVEEMVELARKSAREEGLEDAIEFRVADFTETEIEPADVTLLVGVIEYYRDLESLLCRVARATREMLVIADTRGPWWRRALRHALARVERFNLYYRPPEQVSAVLARHGLSERARMAGHSFTVMAYARESAD